MAKVLGKLKLAPNVTAWCDEVNHIYLRRPQHTCKDIMAGVDLEPITRGVNAGYVIFNDIKPVQKAPATSVDVKVNNIKENIRKKRKAKEEVAVAEEVKKVVEPVKEEVKTEEEPKEDK